MQKRRRNGSWQLLHSYLLQQQRQEARSSSRARRKTTRIGSNSLEDVINMRVCPWKAFLKFEHFGNAPREEGATECRSERLSRIYANIDGSRLRRVYPHVFSYVQQWL